MRAARHRTIWKTALAALLMLTPAVRLVADSGVLVPADKQAPDPSILSLSEMQVDIRIDNGDARVWVRQIFANHTARVEEGNYLFSLPGGTAVSDFAVWDGPVRIPAIILERKRANALYQQLKSQAIDPGLLEQGERSDEDARRNSVFSAHIVPIPAYGTKRVEMEYHQSLPVDAGKSYFVLPLKPSAYAGQRVARLSIRLEVHSAGSMRAFTIPGKQLSFKVERQDEHSVVGTATATDIDLAEDFTATWNSAETGNALQVIAYRDARASAARPSPDPDASAHPQPTQAPPPNQPPPGFFEATAQLSRTPPAGSTPSETASAARTVLVLMDTSLSMQWDKLERSYAAAAKLLASLHPGDRFNLILFNTRVDLFRPQAVNADAATVAAAMEWMRASHLRGGTDLQKALEAALQQSASSSPSTLVLLTDGGVDRGIVPSGKLADWYAARWNAMPPPQRPKTDVFAVGDDANLPLLRLLASHDGVLEHVLSSEPVDFRLGSFLAKVGQSPLEGLRLDATPGAAVEKVYALDDAVFDGGEARWVGQYSKPTKGAGFRVTAAGGISAKTTADLPAEALEHDQLPRLWANARVAALLMEIERNGENAAAIDEIIQLSRRYKFVTPYTSFLAAPRALLRPRVIRPGDPVLRVHTDPSITSVIALFPFGLERPLRYLRGEDVWQTRFLAPPEMKDGTYDVRLLLRDRSGHVYREAKSFVIASTPPTVRVRLDRRRYRAGERIPLRVSASETTRTLTAQVEGLAPVSLRWNREAGANTGELWLPAGMPAGEYTVAVTGEDVAHNLGSAEVRIEVLP